MAHDEHRALIVHEEVLEPDDARKVEVVRRLVEQDNIRVAEERLREQHLDLEARVYLAHKALVQRGVDAQPLKDAPGVALGLPAAELGELLLKLRSADAVFIRKIRFIVYCVLLLAAVIEPLVAHDDGVKHGVIVVQALVLLEYRHTLLCVERDAAARRFELAGEDLYKGGLARAVRADNAVAVAGGELQVYARKQHGRAELHGKVVYRKHMKTPFKVVLPV